MAYTREDRVALHKKQETNIVKTGQPIVTELSDGVPVVRDTPDGLGLFVRYNNVLYKAALTKVEG